MTDAELETKCDACKGEGTAGESWRPELCESCNGAGFVPTPFGRKLLALVAHNIRRVSVTCECRGGPQCRRCDDNREIKVQPIWDNIRE